MRDIFGVIGYIKPFKFYVLIAALTMFVQVFVSFYIPFLIIDIIDVALPNRDFNAVLSTGGIMLMLAFLGIISGVINTYTSQKVSQFATANLRLDVFKRIQTLSFKNVDELKQSRLITNATNDVMRVEMFFTMMLRIILRAPLMMMVGLFLALRTSLLLSQVFYVTLPLLIIAILIIMYFAYPRFKKVQLALDELNNVALENANAPQVIKSFVSQDYETKRYERTNENYRKVNTAAETIMAFADPVITFIFNLGLAGILIVGTYYLTQGQLIQNGIPQVGLIMAFNSYSMQILIGLMMFAMVMIFLSRANVSAARINEIFNTKIDLTNPPQGKTPVIAGSITFADVSFGYGKNGNNVLKDVNLTINAGEKVGIIGSTGSGKSTFVYLIPRLYDVQRGKVCIDGINIKDFDIPTLRKQIGFVTQYANIFSGSLATNMMQGLEDADITHLDQASKQALLYEFIQEKDEGYNYLIRPKGTNLSGGQKQRLSIARAMIKRPKILIFDDATSAVDAASEQKILQHIDALDYRPTLLLISQKVATVKKLDKILVFANDGKVDGFGTHEQLLKTSLVYREIANSQLGLGGAYDVQN